VVPRHKGIPGNEVADGWAKQASSEPDDRGVKWLTLVNGDRLPSRPTFLAHLKRRASENWPEARSETTQQEVRPPGATPARAEKRTASMFYQLKSGHAFTGVYLKSTDNRPDDHC